MQHRGSFHRIGRLPQNLSFYTDYRVRAEHDVFAAGAHGFGFFPCHSQHVLPGRLAGLAGLIDGCGTDDVLERGGGQQFMSSGRRRSKDQHFILAGKEIVRTM